MSGDPRYLFMNVKRSAVGLCWPFTDGFLRVQQTEAVSLGSQRLHLQAALFTSFQGTKPIFLLLLGGLCMFILFISPIGLWEKSRDKLCIQFIVFNWMISQQFKKISVLLTLFFLPSYFLMYVCMYSHHPILLCGYLEMNLARPTLFYLSSKLLFGTCVFCLTVSS